MEFETKENTSKVYHNGSKWDSINYGEFKVIGKSLCRKGYYIIQFKNGSKKEVFGSNISRGSFKNENDVSLKRLGVGERYETLTGWFTIIKYPEGDGLYTLEFDEYNKVKYKTKKSKTQIKNLMIRNPYYSSVCGVGYLGEYNKTIDSRYIRNKWTTMIRRCYDLKNIRYSLYGGIGISVCNRWLCFANFLQDFFKLSGYDEFKKQELDKDLLQKDVLHNKKIYSPSTCCLVSGQTNIDEKNERINDYFLATHLETGYQEVSYCKTKFSNKFNLNKSQIGCVLLKKEKHHRGWIFEYITNEKAIHWNNTEGVNHKKKENYIIDYCKNYNRYRKILAIRLLDNYEEIIQGNVKEFCKINNISIYGLNQCLNNIKKEHNGWSFKLIKDCIFKTLK